MEIIIAIIILSSLFGSLTKNKNQAGQGRAGRYERSDQGHSQRSEGVEDAWAQLKRRIDEASGATAGSERRVNGPIRSEARKVSRATSQRGGTTPRHRRVTADTSEPTENRFRDRAEESRISSSVAARKAEIAESIAYWEANRTHMRAINKDFNEFIERQHQELEQGIMDYKVGSR